MADRRPATAGDPPADAAENAGVPASASPPAAAPATEARTPGWREVLTLGAVVVAIVLGLAIATSLLPTSLQDVVFRTPLAIIVLVIGTVGLLLWIARRPTPRV